MNDHPPLPVLTRVLELPTGIYLFYTLPPAQAVRCAYAQFGKGDYNTWDYDLRYPVPEIHYSEKGVGIYTMGDYTALADQSVYQEEGSVP